MATTTTTIAPAVLERLTNWATQTQHTVTVQPKTSLNLTGSHAYDGWFIDFTYTPLPEPITLDRVQTAILPEAPDEVDIQLIPYKFRTGNQEKGGISQRKAVTSIRDRAKALLRERPKDTAVFGIGLHITASGADLTPYPYGVRMGSAYSEAAFNCWPWRGGYWQLAGYCALPRNRESSYEPSIFGEAYYRSLRPLLTGYVRPDWVANVAMVLHRPDLDDAISITRAGDPYDTAMVEPTAYWTTSILDDLMPLLPEVDPMDLTELAARLERASVEHTRALVDLLSAMITHYGKTPAGELLETSRQLFGLSFPASTVCYDSRVAPASVQAATKQALHNALEIDPRSRWETAHPSHRSIRAFAKPAHQLDTP